MSIFNESFVFVERRNFVVFMAAMVSLSLLLFFNILFVTPVEAAITEVAPPIDSFFPPSITIGGGAVLPLANFRLQQTSGTETLTKVGVQLIASTTMSLGEVSRISLWMESGSEQGFQLDKDTFVAGAASTSPDAVNGSLILLTPGTPVSIGSASSEFYIVASTTGIVGITNGHAFNLNLQTNYASTSGLMGVGTAFASNKKVNLNQAATLKISEVKAGSTGNASDEFIELYNSGEADINLADVPIFVHSFYPSGSSTPGVSLTYYKRVIPSHGYFLIANQIGYGGSTPPDAVFATSTFSVILPNGGVSIATSSPGNTATSTAIDYLGWGDQGAGNCENADTTGSACATALAENGSSLERIAVGYPNATSTASTMVPGGVDSTKGNGLDRNDNSAEFVLQTTANPQNSASPHEFPFGGGQADTSTLKVEQSFPSNNMTGIPVDMQYVGFNLNKPVSTTTVISLSATTTVTLTAAGSSTNLCTSVSYNPSPGSYEPQTKCHLSASLSPSTTYTFTATSTILDLSGNVLDQDQFQPGRQPFSISFTTGGAGQTLTNVTPPNVIGTSPFNNSSNIPTNLSKIMIEFNQASMDLSTFTASNILLSGGETLSGFSFSTSSNKNVLTANTDGSLAANTKYTITIGTGVKSSQGISLPAAYPSSFTTSGVGDLTAPTVVGIIPTPATTIPASTNDFLFIFDDALDASTATSGAVTLAISGGASLPGSVRYDPVSKEGHFTTSNVLPVGQTLVLTIKGASIRNSSNVALGTDVTRSWTVEASNSDTSGPSILYVNADEFNVAITFNEAVNTTDATNLSNYSLTVGGVAQTLSGLAGHNMTYDSSTRTVKLTGLRVTSGATVSVTAQNIKDVSGNLMNGTSSGSCTSRASTGSSGSGGFVGPGSFEGSTFGEKKDFSSAGIGFMPPVNIRPSSTFVNSSSTYSFELPLSKQIDANGSVVITFPPSSDFGLCCVATTSSKNPFLRDQNKDINGPSTGTVGIKTIGVSGKSVTLTLDTATRSENSDTHDFLKFSLADIKNASIPKGIDSSGYSIDIKSKKADGTVLESFSANPVYIGGGSLGGGATTTIAGTVSGNGANLQGVLIHMMSPQTGPLDSLTDSNGIYQFTNIPVNSTFLSNNFGGGGEYFLFTDPFINPTGTTTAFFGKTAPTPVQATSTSRITRNFSLTATSSANNITVRLTASANTFTSSEEVDVFAGGPGEFIVRTVVPGASALDRSIVTTMPIPQSNGSWGVGIGPAMPKGTGGGFSGPPPAPTWSMPKPANVVISGCPTACSFTIDGVSTSTYNISISVADKAIAGVLKDGSGNAVASAEVFAYSPAGGIGNHAQTSATGAFSIRVVSGSYVVGAFVPGMSKSKEVPVVVDSSGNVYVDSSQTVSTGSSGSNPFVLKMVKPGFTITGQVTDGSSAVGNAPVYAYRTDGFGHADAVTDSSTGNYTMYVDNGTWKVGSFIPGFGPMAEQTVTVSGANQSNINFAPSSSASFSILSGNLYEDSNGSDGFDAGEGLSGAMIRISGSSGSNEGFSGNDGAYSIRVPSGTGYTISDIFSPSYGRIAALGDNGAAIGTINLTSSTTKAIRVPKRNTVTVNIKDSSGNLLVVPEAFIDFFNTTTRQGFNTKITNASSTTVSVATGTSPTIRAFIPGVPQSNISIASDSSGTAVASNIVTIDNTTEAIKVVVNTSSANLSTISGTVYHTSATSGNELSEAWIQFVDETNGVFFGVQATSSGKYNIKAADGTYTVIVSKPGYVGPTQTVTVSGGTTQNFVLTSASLTISGTVTAGGSLASNAFVHAEKVGGGQAITQTDTSGAYTLSVTSGVWKVFAAADGYSEGPSSSNPVTVSGSVSGINITLTSTVSLQSKLATSNTFTDTSAGSFKDTTVGIDIDMDTNALGSSGNNSYLTAKETSNFPNTASVNIVANKAKDINAFSGGSQVKNLQTGKSATINLTYTKSELASSGIDTTTEVSTVKMVSYSEDKKEWEALSTIATYLDSNGDTVTSPSANLSNVSSVKFTASNSHFSAYAISAPVGVSPPSTPSGLTATPGAAPGSAISVSWGTSSNADGYFLYRDTSENGSFAQLANVSGASHSDSNVTAGTRYYYKVSAYKSGGASESAASSAVSAVATASTGGGVSGGGGGGGAGLITYSSSAQQTTTKTPATTEVKKTDESKTAVTTTAPTVVVPSTAVPTSVVPFKSPYGRALGLGSRGDDVSALQTFLETKGFLVIPPGILKGYFGQATRKALMDYQKSVGLSPVGAFGPQTKKIVETVMESVTSSVTKTSVDVSAKSPYGRALGLGSRGDDVSALQTFLETKGFLVIPPGILKGYFGQATRKALMDYQKSVGLSPVGAFGPQTKKSVEAETSSEAVSSTNSNVGANAVTPSSAEPASQVKPSNSKLKYQKELALGSEDDEVALLQTFLETKGFLVIPPGILKGYFGQATRKALMDYQKSVGLGITGRLDGYTQTYLNYVEK